MSRDERITVAFLGLHPDRVRALAAARGGVAGVIAAVRAGRVEGVDADALWGRDRCDEALSRARCSVVLHGDDAYPPALAAIPDPPDVLFVRGDLASEQGVGVVGTRRCTGYGRRLAEAYGRSIARSGWVTVSGLARGVDGAAHSGTVAAGGVGVAVLGSGVDVVYPREHARLLDELLEAGGAAVSEYPPGAEPMGWRFPPRNRIISGLSAAVVVVESAVRGGALVTAARAVEQGRAVFAAPGDVGRSASVGCNLLIRDGAVPVLDADDLIEALSLVLGPPRPTMAGAEPTDHSLPEMASVGVPVDDFGRAVGLDGPSLLALLGRLEVEGRIRRAGDLIMPA
jgi:DNA processing protein